MLLLSAVISRVKSLDHTISIRVYLGIIGLPTRYKKDRAVNFDFNLLICEKQRTFYVEILAQGSLSATKSDFESFHAMYEGHHANSITFFDDSVLLKRIIKVDRDCSRDCSIQILTNQ